MDQATVLVSAFFLALAGGCLIGKISVFKVQFGKFCDTLVAAALLGSVITVLPSRLNLTWLRICRQTTERFIRRSRMRSGPAEG